MAILIATLASAVFVNYSDRLSDNIATVDIGEIPKPSPTAQYEEGPTQGPEENKEPVEVGPPPINILLLGSDSRQGENSPYGNPEVHSSERADTTILLHISGDRTWAAAVSFPRDTWTLLPECKTSWGETLGGYDGKFNAAYQIGGPKCTIRLVQGITGIEIDHFAAVDFTGFKNVVDALGGVEICLPEPVSDTASGLSLPAGANRLDGEQSLSFVRARKQLSDGSDIARIGRQQQFLHALADQAISSRLLLDPARLYGVLEAATKSLTTDEKLGSVTALAALALELKAVPSREIIFVTVPWYPRGDGENVLIADEAAEKIWAALANDSRQGLRNQEASKGSERKQDEPSSREIICP